MNTIIAGFIGPQEIIIIIVFIGLPIFFVIWAINKAGKSRQKSLSSQLSKQFNKFREPPISKKEIKDYYPVKEGNKIILIRFDEIVDFSTSNKYVFLTDLTGKEYLADENLIVMETKLPNDFIRVHKSTIINRKLIKEVKKLGNGRFDLVMKCEKNRVISCSKNYNEKIKTIIDF